METHESRIYADSGSGRLSLYTTNAFGGTFTAFSHCAIVSCHSRSWMGLAWKTDGFGPARPQDDHGKGVLQRY